MSKLKTIGDNPLDSVIPNATIPKPEPKPTRKRERITFFLPTDLIEKLRNASFWTPGLTMAEIAERSLEEGLDKMEKKRGEPFPLRQSQLKAGRKVKAL